MNPSQQLHVTFHVGPFFYGVPIEHVQEVLFSQPLSQVPLAPAAVAGLINLRGRIVSVIDLRRLLRCTGSVEEDGMNIVVPFDDGEVSLLVDRVGDVEVVDSAAIEAVPPTLQGAAREFIRGIFSLNGQLLLLLDIRKMLEDELCIRAQLAK